LTRAPAPPQARCGRGPVWKRACLLPPGVTVVTVGRCPEPAEIPHLAAHFASPIRVRVHFLALSGNFRGAAKRTCRRGWQHDRFGACASHAVPVERAIGAVARARISLLNF
jgi:hypothetical protein